MMNLIDSVTDARATLDQMELTPEEREYVITEVQRVFASVASNYVNHGRQHRPKVVRSIYSVCASVASALEAMDK
jgi:hypothetical protein